jgi:uncharacterized membrane protein
MMSSKRGLIVALIVSLCINLALVGFLLGRASSFEFRRDAINPMWGVARIFRELPEVRREELRSHFRAHRQAMRPDLQGIRRAQTDLGAALLADPFDRAELESALDSFRDHLHASQISSNSAFAALVESLTAEERALLVRRMQDRGEQRGQERGGNAQRRDPARRRP